MNRLLILLFSFFTIYSYGQDSVIIYYSFNSDIAPQEKLTNLKNKLLKEASSINKIHGHTDSIGNLLYNQDLSDRRAKKIHDFLSSLDEELLSKTEVQGMGEMNVDGSKGRKVVVYYSPKISVQIRNAKAGETLKINNLNFEPGSDVLLASSNHILNDLLDIMNEFPKLIIAIDGHICCDMNDETNLSTSRAKRVYNFLVKNGIKPERLSFKGFGSTKPLFPLPEINDQQQIANRRVEIRIVSKN